ncbi:MAG: peptidylprolyl isomerase [Bacteroidales bacterium]|nr:peptidylprolyl isomerase [Bacteroidales bacterium]
MSILQTLRERAGVLLAVVIGVSLLFFILGDFLGGGSGQTRKMKDYYEIAEIGGRSVTYQEYDERLQNLVEIYKLSGTSNITEAMSESMREDIWNKLIMEEILGEEFDNIGLGVSPEEVESMVLGDEPHPIVQQLFANRETGVLDKSFLVNFLKSTEYDPQAKTYWLFFENEIVNEKISTKFNNLIAKGLYVTSKQAEFENKLTSNTVDFSFIMRLYSTVPDSSVTASRADLEKYFTNHKEEYRQDARRSMEYIEFEVAPSEMDVMNTEEGIIELIEEFRETETPVQFINLSSDNRHIEVYMTVDEVPEMIRDFVIEENTEDVYGPYLENETYKIARLIAVENRPDSVHARHILISPNAYRTKEMAESEADSLMQLIKSGESFESLAMEFSDDQGSAQLGGDLGWFEEGQMVAPFNNACFEADKGDVVMAESDFGYHIIEILDQSSKSRKYHVGIIERAIEPSSATYQEKYAEAGRFAGNNNTYQKFNEAIANEGLNKKLATDIAPDQKTLPGLESPRELIMALFETVKNNIVLDNSEQAVFEIGDKFVVAYCTDIKEEGYAKLADVESDVRFAVLREKKAEKIMGELRDQAEGLDNIEDIGSALDLRVNEATNISFNSFSIPAAGVEPAVIATASSAPEGFLSGPVKGNNGIFIIYVNNVNSNEEGQNIDFIRNRLISTFEARASFEVFEALKEASDIVDRRYKFY